MENQIWLAAERHIPWFTDYSWLCLCNPLGECFWELKSTRLIAIEAEKHRTKPNQDYHKVWIQVWTSSSLWEKKQVPAFT